MHEKAVKVAIEHLALRLIHAFRRVKQVVNTHVALSKANYAFEDHVPDVVAPLEVVAEGQVIVIDVNLVFQQFNIQGVQTDLQLSVEVGRTIFKIWLTSSVKHEFL